MRLSIIAVTSLFALAACSPQAEQASPDGGGQDAAPVRDPTPAPATTADAAAPLMQEEQQGTIPAALQGRWGMVPQDCTSTRGDAKGLLTIGPDSLKFHESAGKLGEIADRADSRIRASFAFTGEGMNWQRDMELATHDGKTLIRRELGDDASPRPFTYTKC